MNDRVKIYKRAFYQKEPIFDKENDNITLKVNQQKKLRLKERKILNKADGTGNRSCFGNNRYQQQDGSNSTDSESSQNSE